MLGNARFVDTGNIFTLLGTFHLSGGTSLVTTLSLRTFSKHVSPFVSYVRRVHPRGNRVRANTGFHGLLRNDRLVTHPGRRMRSPCSFHYVPRIRKTAGSTVHCITSILLARVGSIASGPAVFPSRSHVVSNNGFRNRPLTVSCSFLNVTLTRLNGVSRQHVTRLVVKLHKLPRFLITGPNLGSNFVVPRCTTTSVMDRGGVCYCTTDDSSVISSGKRRSRIDVNTGTTAGLCHVVSGLRRVLTVRLVGTTRNVSFHHPTGASPILRHFLRRCHGRIPFIGRSVIVCGRVRGAITFLGQAGFSC